ncbi:hypothetical protein Ct9H90mP29_14270 [bacterium]|nr:MAG: hypothetical protein Ct9H90mP29_14270 [bacterium]
MTKEEHGALRSLKIAEEFNLNPWLLGSGYEYRRLKESLNSIHSLFFHLFFPKQTKSYRPTYRLAVLK